MCCILQGVVADIAPEIIDVANACIIETALESSQLSCSAYEDVNT